MKKLVNIGVAALLGAILVGCIYIGGSSRNDNRTLVIPSPHLITKDITDVPYFNQIEVVGGYDITYVQSLDGQTKVSIFGPDNIVDLVGVKVERKTLEVALDKNVKLNGSADIEIFIASPDLNTVRLTGSSDFTAKSEVTASAIFLLSSGSGDIDIPKLSADKVIAHVTGSGKIELGGRVDDANFDVTGSGDISARMLLAEQVNATVTGSGNIYCHVTEQLTTSVTGSGNIAYTGWPIFIRHSNPKAVQQR